MMSKSPLARVIGGRHILRSSRLLACERVLLATHFEMFATPQRRMQIAV